LQILFDKVVVSTLPSTPLPPTDQYFFNNLTYHWLLKEVFLQYMKFVLNLIHISQRLVLCHSKI